jgi:hypothetical protein
VPIHHTVQKHKLAQPFSLTCVHTPYLTETWYATFHSCYRCSYLMLYGSVVDGHEEGTEYCPISTATSTCYWQGDSFQDISKNSRSVKSVLVRGLHQNLTSPNDTVTYPRKPKYSHSANHATRASNLVTKEVTAYWYSYIHRL